jgi:hypothetical protein
MKDLTNIELAYLSEIKDYLTSSKEHNVFFKTKDRLDVISSFLKKSGVLTDEREKEIIKEAQQQANFKPAKN